MKQQINFVTDSTQNIDGYLNINILTDLNTVINGSLDNILCESLDSLSAENRMIAFKEILNKLAFEGAAIFKFVNMTLLANRTLKNEIDSNKLSNIISSLQSVWTEYYTTEIFNSIPNIQIEKYYLDYIYTVITIKKKL